MMKWKPFTNVHLITCTLSVEYVIFWSQSKFNISIITVTIMRSPQAPHFQLHFLLKGTVLLVHDSIFS